MTASLSSEGTSESSSSSSEEEEALEERRNDNRGPLYRRPDTGKIPTGYDMPTCHSTWYGMPTCHSTWDLMYCDIAYDMNPCTVTCHNNGSCGANPSII